MILQSIIDIAEICAQHGLQNAILSPGSRSAPLTLAFARHPHFNNYSISDERSAAFIGLGLAQASQKASILVCTSGSAAYNYAPAVAEAYFQETPLLILTADRPPEWIDQWDGQTIRQENIYGKHVKRSFQLPTDLEHKDAKWHANRIINEAINCAHDGVKGPVHVNIPFREPFYPEKGEQWTINKEVRVIKSLRGTTSLSEEQQKELLKNIQQKKRIAILLGQEQYSASFLSQIEKVSLENHIPVFADVISNGHSIKDVIQHTDALAMRLLKKQDETYLPDLFISFGKSIISKNLKLYLRQNEVEQWHVKENNSFLSDPFQSITKTIESDLESFLSIFSSSENSSDSSYKDRWLKLQSEIIDKQKEFFSVSSFSEFYAIREVLNNLSENYHLHLANSMAVRYANFVSITKPTIKVWANRGTSGIDGSNSTAMGHALQNKQQNLLVTGDVAFFYDRNAFWHNYAYNNLKILLLNNSGGGIFRMINGPKDLPELAPYFETEQKLNAQLLAKEFDIKYRKAEDTESFTRQLEDFLSEKGPALFEIHTDSKHNQAIFNTFKTVLTS